MVYRTIDCLHWPGYLPPTPCVHATVNMKTLERNESENPLFYFHRKKPAQVGFEPTTSFQSTKVAQLVGLKSHKLNKAKCLINRVNSNSISRSWPG